MAGSECRRGGLVSCAEPRTGRFGLLLHTFCLRAYEALGTGCGSEQNPEIPAPWSFLMGDRQTINKIHSKSGGGK